MTANVQTIPLGSAIVTVMNVGDILFPLSEGLNVAESEWRPQYADIFERPLPFPSQCIHIALPGASVLVDANIYELAFPPDSPYVIPGYQPPPGLLTQLRERGVSPEDITHLVITHAHFDHYAGVTIERNGEFVPCFPNARCFLGRRDWEQAELQKAVQEPSSKTGRTLGVLHRAGLLELIEGNYDLLPSVQIIAAPGESPGHQVVRVRSEGQTLYCLGDLFHHPVEVEHPDWMAGWADIDANRASRKALIEAALAEEAVLVAAHMAVGRIQRTASGIKWVTL